MAPEGLTLSSTSRRRRRIRCLLPVLAVLLAAGCSAGTAGGGPPLDPFSGLLAFYRGPLDHLSAVRRGVCPMHPSCSEYARQAAARHGGLVGWIMASDRLLRCGRDETRLAPKVKIDGEWRYDDPLDRNDFWWRGGAPAGQQTMDLP